MPDIPPWLTRDYNPVETYMRSFAAGAQIGEAQSRLAEEQRQANMHAMAQRESLQANILRAQVELDTQKAYHDQQLALRQQELQQEAQRTQMTAEKAANDLAERQAYHQTLMGLRQREVTVKEKGNEYGEPTTIDIPGLPGVKGIYRPGSPGIHVVKPYVEPKAKITVKDSMSGESITARTDDPALELFRKSHGLIPEPAPTNAPDTRRRILGIPIPGTSVPSPAQTQASPYPEGTRLVRKGETEARWIVRGGVPVPLDSSTSPDESSDEEE